MLEQLSCFPPVNRHHPEAKDCQARCIDQGQQKASANVLEPLLREAQSEMKEERWLQGLGDNIDPENGPVQRVQGPGVLECVPSERNQTEQVEMGGAGRSPAAKEDIDPDGEINKADHAQGLLNTPIRGLRDHDHGRVQVDTIARDGVLGLVPNASSVELAHQVRNVCNGRSVDSRQEVISLDSVPLTGAVGEDSFGEQAVPVG